MIYRENGQFKTSYAADSQILPIRQDRIGMALLTGLVLLMVLRWPRIQRFPSFWPVGRNA